MLENTNVREINDAIVVLRELNDDEKMKYLSEMREKALHDEASALNAAEEKGRLDILINLVKDGILTLTDAAKRADMTVFEFKEKTGLNA